MIQVATRARAVTSSIMLASRLDLCKPLDQSYQSALHRTGAWRDRSIAIHSRPTRVTDVTNASGSVMADARGCVGWQRVRDAAPIGDLPAPLPDRRRSAGSIG